MTPNPEEQPTSDPSPAGSCLHPRVRFVQSASGNESWHECVDCGADATGLPSPPTIEPAPAPATGEELAKDIREMSEELKREVNLRFALQRELEEAKDANEKAMLRTIDERDEAQEAISNIYHILTGKSAEWSNEFGFEQAAEELSAAHEATRQRIAEQDAEITTWKTAFDDYANRLHQARSLIAELEKEREEMIDNWSVTLREKSKATSERDQLRADLAVAKSQLQDREGSLAIVRNANDEGRVLLNTMRADLAASQALCAKMREALTSITDAERFSHDPWTAILQPDKYGSWVMVNHETISKAISYSPSEALAEMLKSAWEECWNFRAFEDNTPEDSWQRSETFRRLEGGGAK